MQAPNIGSWGRRLVTLGLTDIMVPTRTRVEAGLALVLALFAERGGL